MNTGPAVFWSALAILYFGLSMVTLRTYVKIRRFEKASGGNSLAVTASGIAVGTELDDIEGPYLVVSGMFKSVLLADVFGFILAVIAAVISGLILV